MFVHDDMDFYVTPTEFILEPHARGERLIINRRSQAVQLQAYEAPKTAIRHSRRVCGLLGAISNLDHHYLIVATHRIFVGFLDQQPIWQLAGYEILAYHQPETPGQPASAAEQAYLQLVRQVLDTPFFYFSYTYELSHSLQRQHQLGAPVTGTSLAARAEPRFTWNRALLANMLATDPMARDALRQYALPLVHGFVSVHCVQIGGRSFTWAICSRRSVQRAGTRLFMRGINERGECANFVETEQLVECDGERAAFVQTRGSIPLFWTQAPNLRYKPRPQLDGGRDHLAAAGRHVVAQQQLYGRQVMINLIDHRGSELELEQAFGRLIAELADPTVRYESFDFHAECRKMRWDRLHILIDRLAHEQDEFGQFWQRRDGSVAQQTGVFRTNCIDCLDRTNVVQSMLARRSLEQTLQQLGVLAVGGKLEAAADFNQLYKNVWADNADLVSTQYSGTGALKTDFTRTGKRTKQGVFWDGWNSTVRYFKNNFRDGRRQDAIDFVVGNDRLALTEQEWSALVARHRGWKYNTLPSVLLFASVMFLSSAILPQEYNTENLLFMMFWGAVVAGTIRGIFTFGSEFVDKPRLQERVRPNDA